MRDFILLKKSKYILMSLATSAIVILLITMNTYRKNIETEVFLKNLSDKKNINEQVMVLTQMIENSQNFLLFVSELKTIKEYSKEQVSSDEIKDFFKSIMKYSKNYSQIRVLSSNGLEKIRMNRLDNEIVIVDEKELQDKSERYYYKELRQMEIGKLWVSSLDPNIENEVIEEPINPTIRMGFRLENSEIFIINISLQKEFRSIKDSYFLQNEKKLKVETNSGIWSITKDSITYKNQIKNKEFYIIGFLNGKEEKNLNKEVLIISIFENLKGIILVILLTTLIFFINYRYICQKNLTSYLDILTDCYNRNFYETRLKELKGLNNYKMCYIDIDNLKKMNDNFGHKNGDLLIRKITNDLKSTLEKNELIIRMGGDEFLVLSKKSKVNLETRIEKIVSKLSLEKICGMPILFSYGIGNGKSFKETLKSAEEKMYHMKRNKKR